MISWLVFIGVTQSLTCSSVYIESVAWNQCACLGRNVYKQFSQLLTYACNAKFAVHMDMFVNKQHPSRAFALRRGNNWHIALSRKSFQARKKIGDTLSFQESDKKNFHLSMSINGMLHIYFFPVLLLLLLFFYTTKTSIIQYSVFNCTHYETDIGNEWIYDFYHSQS